MGKHRSTRNCTVINLTSGGRRQNQEMFLFQPQESDNFLQQQTRTKQNLSQQQETLSYLKNWPILVQKNDNYIEESHNKPHEEPLEIPHEEPLEIPHEEPLEIPFKESLKELLKITMNRLNHPKKSNKCSYQIMSKFDGCTQISTTLLKTYNTHKRACEFCSTWINYERKKLSQMENSLHEKSQTGILTFLKWGDYSWTATTEL